MAEELSLKEQFDQAVDLAERCLSRLIEKEMIPKNNKSQYFLRSMGKDGLRIRELEYHKKRKIDIDKDYVKALKWINANLQLLKRELDDLI